MKKRYGKKETVTTQEITEVLSDALPNISASTISWRINQLKNENLIHQAGRGLYSFEFKPDYNFDLSLKTKRIYNRVKALATSEICVWDTNALDSILGVDNTKSLIFLSVVKEDLEPLFNNMQAFSKQVFLNPDKETIKRYLKPLEEAIVLTPMVSETPLIKTGDYVTPTLEGLLVNSLCEFNTTLDPMGYSMRDLFALAFEKYSINRSKLLRFASRRDKKLEIETLLKNIL
ncbi:MAG: hypothetical protein JNK73_06220 [Bacteroidia bacterium]|nr:hypothetical protein [Bacteroidia bacterium]